MLIVKTLKAGSVVSFLMALPIMTAVAFMVFLPELYYLQGPRDQQTQIIAAQDHLKTAELSIVYSSPMF